MSTRHPAAPAHIASRLPVRISLEKALEGSVAELQPGHQIVRIAWNALSVWPDRVGRTYRFGPPATLADSAGVFPFHWVYTADEAMTACWEAQLCLNDVTRPGTFHFQQNASSAILATFDFGIPLRLFDLTGSTASKLGIFDELRSPDYEWCQWFGCQLDQMIAQQNGAVHGFRYPSRRRPGHDAYAISSRVLARLAASMSISTISFSDTVHYASLMADPCRVPPP